MNAFIEEYKQFLDNGKTERECVNQIVAQAEKAGYSDLLSAESVKAGDKLYLNKMGKSVMLFHVGRKPLEEGMRILGAHIDSPRLDLKPNPLYEKEKVVYLNTHYYGGIKKYQWLALPLALHGVVIKKDGTKVEVNIGEKESDPVFVISDILPHIAQEQMKKTAAEFINGEDLDLVVGINEEDKDDDGRKRILEILEKELGIEEEDFRSAEIEVVPAGRTRDVGFNRDLVLGYGQDDRVCAFPSMAAVLSKTETPEYTGCAILVDKEEIGSYGATGMQSHVFDNAVAELVYRAGGNELGVRRCLEHSLMLSSDVSAAYDPLNAALFDKNNASPLSGGVVFNKYTGSRGKGGSSDANPEFIAILRKCMDDAQVKWQIAEMAKVDIGGGGTIAHMAADYGMQVIDCGVPVLSMHAPWELTSKFDIEQAYKAYCAFLDIK